MLALAQSLIDYLPGLIPLFDESPTATPPVTATVGLTPTATPIAALPTPTPPAAASLWAPGQWLQKTGWSAGFHGAFLGLFLLIAIAAIVVYFYFFQRRFKHHKLNARLAERFSMILTAFASVGLLFLVFALGSLPLLSAPLWLILTAVIFIAFLVYAVYYYASVYPHELAKHNRELERARYIPKGKSKGPAYTPPMKRKQKRK